MRERTVADDAVQGAANRALLELIIGPVRIAAKHVGYAVAVHGSLNRDIDLIAVPWIDAAGSPEDLVSAVCGAAAGVTGSCMKHGKEFTVKPHGRIAATLLVYCGQKHMEIDISIMPRSVSI